jgi:hypothetical protein
MDLDWVDFSAANSQAGLSLQKLLTRLANLDFVQSQLHYMKVRFFALSSDRGAAYFDETALFKTAHEIIFDASKVTLNYLKHMLICRA